MVKRRGTRSPLGNTVGSKEAEKFAARANLDSLSNQLSAELKKTGETTTEFLQARFGINSVGQSVVWKLASGAKATFNEVTLSYEQVKDVTVVTFDVNGRDQTLLTKESLEDLNSLEFQQFYPAVGRQVNSNIDILDGSRRRAWFLQQKGRVKNFRILVTKDEISIANAKALAKQLQTAKEHNLREIGLQCKAIMGSGDYSQEDVANMVGVSRPGVSKALKAANIHPQLIALFPVVNDLSHTDYSVLDKVMKATGDDADELVQFIRKISKKPVNVQPEQSHYEQKELIINVIKTELKIVSAKNENNNAEVTAIAEFDTKGIFARKRVKGRNFSYEFGRLPKSVQDELDKAIASVIENYSEK